MPWWLVTTIRKTLQEDVGAEFRALVNSNPAQTGCPPDKQEKATITVLEQAEVLSEGWATA